MNQCIGSKTELPQFTRSYGLVFDQTEPKAIFMALDDRALRREELGKDDVGTPVQDTEFVLSQADTPRASGFVEHFKLPLFVGFQSELEFLRKLRQAALQVTRDAAE